MIEHKKSIRTKVKYFVCAICAFCAHLYTLKQSVTSVKYCFRYFENVKQWLQNYALPNFVYLSVKRSSLVSMVVTHGICFCWCIIGISGVLDSKSYATR